MINVGICKVCGGNIKDDAMGIGVTFYCDKCGIAYYKVPKELCNKDGLRIIYNIE